MITATNFYDYIQCPMRVYLDKYGYEEDKLPYSEFMLMKFKSGRDHEANIMSDMKFEQPKFIVGNLEEGFAKTLEFMEQGVDRIYQGVLMHNDLVGEPDLLEKMPGKSKFGDYYYVATDIKLGKSLKPEYIMQLEFYSFLLAKVQGFIPLEATVILGNGKKEIFKINDHILDFMRLLRSITAIVKGDKRTPHLCSVCNECIWREHCHNLVIETNELSQIFNLSKNVKRQLIEQGIRTVRDAANMDLASLSRIKTLGESTLTRIKNQAIALTDNRPVVINKPVLPKTRYEIFYDIEGETLMDVDYLFGILIRCDGKEEYRSFVAERPEDEEKAWEEFLDFLSGLDDFTIYHYASYEMKSLRKLAERYGMDDDLLEKIKDNMIDLFSIVRSSVILPVESYSLKSIAKHFGFKWRFDNAGGTQSMVWYHSFLKDPEKNKDKLDLLKQYNEDDCRATLVLKDNLEKFS